MNSRVVRLIEHPRLRHQLISLERSTRSGGKDKIDHPKYGRDDVINAAAGAALMANDYGAVLPPHRRQSHAIGGSHNIMASPEENAAALAREEAQLGYWSGPGWAPTWNDNHQPHQAGEID